MYTDVMETLKTNENEFQDISSCKPNKSTRPGRRGGGFENAEKSPPKINIR